MDIKDWVYEQDCRNCTLEQLREHVIWQQNDCRYLRLVLDDSDGQATWREQYKARFPKTSDWLRSEWQKSLAHSHKRMAVALAIYNERLDKGEQ